MKQPTYFASVDPYQKPLNWFQRLLCRVGLYKEEKPEIYIFKKAGDLYERITLKHKK